MPETEPSQSRVKREGAPRIRPLDRPEIPTPHLYPRYDNEPNTISSARFKDLYEDEMKTAQNLIDAAKNIITRAEGENDVEHYLRVIGEVESRLKYVGDYEVSDDPIAGLVREQNLGVEKPFVLMGVEVARVDIMQTENDKELKRGQKSLAKNFRQDTRTEVGHTGNISNVQGAYEHVLEEYNEGWEKKKRWNEQSRRDALAFWLVADRLGDVVDPSQKPGESKTYRQKLQDLDDIVRDPASKKSEKDNAANAKTEVRQQFFERVIDVMINLQNDAYFNSSPQSLETQANIKMRELITQALNTPLEELISQYEGVTTGLSQRSMDEMRQKLANVDKASLLDYATKGADFMKRRTSFNPKLYEIPPIHYKKFVEGPEETPQEPERRIGTPPKVPDKTPPGPGPTPPGEDGPPEPPPPAPPEPVKPPAPPPPPTDITVDIAAGKKTQIVGERPVYTEVFEANVRQLARDRMTEDREKWGRRLSLGRFIERAWKWHIGEISTYGKEKGHAYELQAQSGLQTIVPDLVFLRGVDTLARQNISTQRRGFGRLTGAIRDFGNEFIFRQKDLHRERVNVIRQLRQAVDNPNDPNLAQFIQNNQALVNEFRNMVRADYQAAEGMAQRLTDGFGDELVHTVAGERKGQQKIDLTGAVGDFFKQEVMQPLLANGIANGGTINEQVLFDTRRKVQEFFFSPRFTQWYDSQVAANPALENDLMLSLTYGTDIIPVIQEVILPQIMQMKAHDEGAFNLESYMKEVVLKSNVGTLEAGGKTVVGEGRMERAASRAVTNQEVLRVYQRLRAQGAAPNLVPQPHLSAAVGRAEILGRLARVGTHQAVIGIGAGLGIWGAQRAGFIAGNALVPVIGGSVASGIMRGFQENRLFTREREQHEAEREINTQFPQDAARRRQMIEAERHKRVMETDLTVPMEQRLAQLNQPGVPINVIRELMGLIADTKARYRLRDTQSLGLLASTNPLSYDAERTRLETTTANAGQQLRTIFNSNPGPLDTIGQQLGVAANYDTIMDNLIDIQVNHIRTAAQLTGEQQLFLGSVAIGQGESLDARNRTSNRLRVRRVAMEFSKTAFLAPLTFVGIDFAADRAYELVQAGLATPVGQQISGAVQTGAGWAGERARNIPAAPWVGDRFSELGGAARGAAERLGVITPVRFNAQTGQELFKKPTNMRLNDELTLAVDPLTHAQRVMTPHEGPPGTTWPNWPDVRNDVRAISFLGIDQSGQKITIDSHPFFLRSDGALISYGEPADFAKLDPRVQSFLTEWQRNNLVGNTSQEQWLNQWFNIKDDVKDILTNPNRNPDDFIMWHHMMIEMKDQPGIPQDVFNKIDPALLQQINGPIRMLELTYRPEEAVQTAPRWIAQAAGYIGQNGDPHIIVSQAIPGNERLMLTQFNEIAAELGKDAWQVNQLNPGTFDFVPANATVYMPPAEKIDIPGIPIVMPRKPLEAPEKPKDGRQPFRDQRRPTVQKPPTSDQPTRREPPIEDQPTRPLPLTPDQERRRQDLRERREKQEQLSDDEETELNELEQRLVAVEEFERQQRESQRQQTPDQQQEQQQLQEQGPAPLQRRFEAVVGPVVRENNRFFVENPPEHISIPDNELTQYESREPFFNVNSAQQIIYTNEKIVPWARELGHEQGSDNRRFINGEAATGGDSGLFGLSAASSENPQQQAKLYRALADIILRIHEQNPRLLIDWLAQQGADPETLDQITSSLAIFKLNDIQRLGTGGTRDEVLFPYKNRRAGNEREFTLMVEAAQMEEFWQPRIAQLRSAHTQDRFTSYHLRWIEFLSHSVDVAGLIDLTKSQQTTPP